MTLLLLCFLPPQLEATLDLTERRQIRSAIRELRRQELERDEEALASKRFRTERQENKENRLRSWQREEEQRQQKSLDALSRKLETIQDVEELTGLLRGTSEYEERKLIRAAIRKLRAEEIEAATLAGKAFNNRRAADTVRASKEQDENAAGDRNTQMQKRAGQELVQSQMQEQLDPKGADAPEVGFLNPLLPQTGSSLGTILLLEAVPSHAPSASAPFPDNEAGGEDPGPNSQDEDAGPEPQPSSREEEEEEEEEAEGLAPPKGEEGLSSSQTRKEEQLEEEGAGGEAPPKEESLLSQNREVPWGILLG
ncbi:hypothetical protein Chor_012981 [Crotalus horridus]